MTEALGVDSNEVLAHVGEDRLAAGIGAKVCEGPIEKNFLNGVMAVRPHSLEAAAVVIGAGEAAVFVPLDAGRINDAAVHDAKHFAGRNIFGTARKKVAAVNAAFAGNNAAATEFEKNLLEIFDWNAVATGDLMYRDNFGKFHRKMENSAGGVLAFGRNSHGYSACRLPQ